MMLLNVSLLQPLQQFCFAKPHHAGSKPIVWNLVSMNHGVERVAFDREQYAHLLVVKIHCTSFVVV